MFNSSILVDIFDPPMIAVLGFSGLLKKMFRFLISFSKLSPAIEGKNLVMLTIEAWYLWEAENASFTYKSKLFENSFEKSGISGKAPKT